MSATATIAATPGAASVAACRVRSASTFRTAYTTSPNARQDREVLFVDAADFDDVLIELLELAAEARRWKLHAYCHDDKPRASPDSDA